MNHAAPASIPSTLLNSHPNPAAFLSASFIRLCQPGPVSRNLAITSASSLSVTCFFAAPRSGGRPTLKPVGER
jgi:hypothetical protein